MLGVVVIVEEHALFMWSISNVVKFGRIEVDMQYIFHRLPSFGDDLRGGGITL